MELEKIWQDEINKRDNFYKKMGELIGYTGEQCICCGRNRVEKFSTGIRVCEKCGTDQLTKKYMKTNMEQH